MVFVTMPPQDLLHSNFDPSVICEVINNDSLYRIYFADKAEIQGASLESIKTSRSSYYIDIDFDSEISIFDTLSDKQCEIQGHMITSTWKMTFQIRRDDLVLEMNINEKIKNDSEISNQCTGMADFRLYSSEIIKINIFQKFQKRISKLVDGVYINMSALIAHSIWKHSYKGYSNFSNPTHCQNMYSSRGILYGRIEFVDCYI